MTNKQALREAAEKHGDDDILALLDELEAKDRRIAELEGIATSARPYQVESGRWGCPICHYQGHESAVYAALCVFCSNKDKGED